MLTATRFLTARDVFVASKEWLDKLFANGQVATQYVDYNGNLAQDEEWNMNGSYAAIEVSQAQMDVYMERWRIQSVSEIL